jgi:hypothetical protein
VCKFSRFCGGIYNSIVSVVTGLWAGQPRSRGLILGTSRLTAGSTLHPVQCVLVGAFPPGVKRLAREAYHSSQSSSDPDKHLRCAQGLFTIFFFTTVGVQVVF